MVEAVPTPATSDELRYRRVLLKLSGESLMGGRPYGVGFSIPGIGRWAVDSITTQILNKLLHLPTVRMKEAAAASDAVLYADAVRHLFGLEEER